MSFPKMLRVKDNPQIDRMTEAALDLLKEAVPEKLSHRSGAIYDTDKNTLLLESFGETVAFSCPGYESELQKTDPWQYITLLQYFAISDGTVLSGKWIALSELPGGAFRGMGFDSEIDELIKLIPVNISADTLKTAASTCGGCLINGKADVCAEFRFAPRFPIRWQFWLADEDFPAAGKMLVDGSAMHYLSTEGAGCACIILLKKIIACL